MERLPLSYNDLDLVAAIFMFIGTVLLVNSLKALALGSTNLIN